MKPEMVAKRFQQKDGQRLADFIEIAIPIYRLTVRAITLAHRRIPPIEEFVLRTLAVETTSPAQLSAFLGLEDRVLEPCLVGLVQNGGVSASQNLLRITHKGRVTIEPAEIVSTEERTFSIHFDALSRKIILLRNIALLTIHEVGARGLFEICQSPPVRPRISDLRIPEINKLAKAQYQLGEIKRDLLAITTIENIKKVFAPAVALVYRGADDPEVQIAVAVDGKLSEDHESLLNENPSFQKFLTSRAALDIVSTLVDESQQVLLNANPEDASVLQSAAAATE